MSRFSPEELDLTVNTLDEVRLLYFKVLCNEEMQKEHYPQLTVEEVTAHFEAILCSKLPSVSIIKESYFNNVWM